jgi:serine/threonine protein kinase
MVWKNLSHPRVLPLLGLNADNFENHVCMVSPWMERGTAAKYLEANKDLPNHVVDTMVRPEPRRGVLTLTYLTQILETAQGVAYLHDNEIVHGDLHGVSQFLPVHISKCI